MLDRYCQVRRRTGGWRGAPETAVWQDRTVDGSGNLAIPSTGVSGETMDPTQITLTESQAHRIAKAIADPQRFAILACIAARDEIACKTLVAEFPITQATISHHLKELVAADLISSRRQGQLAILSCRRDICEAYTGLLLQRLVQPGLKS